MKTKLFLCLIIMSVYLQTNAQTIPNSGFENWTWQPGGYDDPDFWNTNNYAGYISVSKTTDSYAGNFALQVVNNGPGLEGPWPGFTATVYSNPNVVNKISAYIKCDSISGTGKGIITVVGFLGTTGQIIGAWETSMEIPQYTLIEIILSPILNYDSTFIKIEGYAENAPNGSSTGYAMLKVDALSEELASDIQDSDINHSLKISPNPFSEYALLTFANPSCENFILLIYDHIGKLVETIEDINSNEVLIGRKKLTNGIYFFKMQKENNYVGSGKFIVQ